jgi:hypothetical protein
MGQRPADQAARQGAGMLVVAHEDVAIDDCRQYAVGFLDDARRAISARLA